jgi:hypothetical protein
MGFIEFNNLFLKKLFNYIRKIDAHKIKHKLKNRYLIEKIIPIESKQKSIIQSIS